MRLLVSALSVSFALAHVAIPCASKARRCTLHAGMGRQCAVHLIKSSERDEDREAKRAAMWADPDWITYTQESAKLGALINQENKLMRPVDFFAEPKR